MRFQEYHIQQNEALAAKAGLLGQPRWTRTSHLLCNYYFVFQLLVCWSKIPSMENKSKTPTIYWEHFLHNGTNPNPQGKRSSMITQLRMKSQTIEVTLVGWRKKFIYSSLSVKPPHRKEAAHFIKKQTYKQSSFKKYYKSSLQAVKVKLQCGCYVQKRKKTKINHLSGTENSRAQKSLRSSWGGQGHPLRPPEEKKKENWLTIDHVSTFCVRSKLQNNKTKINPNVWFNPRLAEKSVSTDFHVQHSFGFYGRNISVT